jgi:hypothetical protein
MIDKKNPGIGQQLFLEPVTQLDDYKGDIRGGRCSCGVCAISGMACAVSCTFFSITPFHALIPLTFSLKGNHQATIRGKQNLQSCDHVAQMKQNIHPAY